MFVQPEEPNHQERGDGRHDHEEGDGNRRLDVVVVYEANTSQVRDQLDVVPLHTPAAIAVQPYAVGKNSDNRLLMQRLLERLRGADSRAKFESVGFHWQEGSSGQ